MGAGCCGGNIKKAQVAGDITLRYLIWYGAGRFWIEGAAHRQPDAGALSGAARASMVVAAVAVVGGIAAEIYFTRRRKDKPLMVPLAVNADNRSLLRKLQKQGSLVGILLDIARRAARQRPRAEFWKTDAYNAALTPALQQALAAKSN